MLTITAALRKFNEILIMMSPTRRWQLLTCFSLHFIDFLMILMELLYRNFNTFLSLSKTANFGKDKSCGEREDLSVSPSIINEIAAAAARSKQNTPPRDILCSKATSRGLLMRRAGSLWHKRAGASNSSEVSSTSRWTSLTGTGVFTKLLTWLANYYKLKLKIIKFYISNRKFGGFWKIFDKQLFMREMLRKK